MDSERPGTQGSGTRRVPARVPDGTAGRKGTAPVGGTTGAVDAPSSGGEELVRRLALPLGGASTAMVAFYLCNSNFSRGVSLQSAPAARRSTEEPGTKRGKRRVEGHTCDGTPGERGAINRGSTRVTKRADNMSHRDKPATIGPSVDFPHVGARLAHGGRAVPVYRSLVRNVRLDFSQLRGLPGPQPRRPARTASQMRMPSSAPATMASEQWPSQSATPCGEPVPYAASAPR